MADRERIAELDVAKGLGILLVILGHALPEDSYLRLVIYSFHMPLFFFLSGIVMKPIDGKPSVKTMFRVESKLLVTYVFYTGVYLFFDIVVRFASLHELSVRGMIWNCYQAGVMYGINVLWFLASLFIGKIIVRCLVVASQHKEFRILIAILLLYFVPTIIAEIIPSPSAAWQRLYWYPLIALLRAITASSFILAGYLGKNKIRNIMKTSGLIGGGYGALSVLILFVACYMLHRNNVIVDMHTMEMGIIPATFILSYIGITGIIAWSIIISKFCVIQKVLAFWGTNSLFVMVTHEYLMIKHLLDGCLTLAGFSIQVFGAAEPLVYFIWSILIEWILIVLFSRRMNSVVDKINSAVKIKD